MDNAPRNKDCWLRELEFYKIGIVCTSEMYAQQLSVGEVYKYRVAPATAVCKGKKTKGGAVMHNISGFV